MMIKKTILFFLAVITIFSCTPQRKIVYFQGKIPSLSDSAFAKHPFQLYIYSGDVLTINVFTINAEAFPFLSTSIERPMSDTRSPYEKGYQVRENGEVKMPLIGTVKLAGLTISAATELIESKFKKYIDDPIVTIRKLNFKITVLGEVNKPGTYNILNEKASLPELLGMAGDLTNVGNRTRVKIIREENNNTQQFVVDLTSANSLAPETYFLHPDDIIYVEPLRRKAFQNISPSVTIFTSILTTAVVVVTFILTSKK